jgi:hypothetical protein
VAVSFDHLSDAERGAALEEELVLVGGVDEKRVTGLATADDEDIVLHRADNVPVDLDGAIDVVRVHGVDSTGGCVVGVNSSLGWPQ